MGAGWRRVTAAGGVRRRSTPQKLGHTERQIDGLSGVQTRITGGGVAQVELVFENVAEAAETFGDVVTSEFDVHAARQVPAA